MSNGLKREYLEILRSRYRAARRRERGQIIDELVQNTGMHRKSAIRCLRKEMLPQRSGRGRKKVYSEDCIRILRRVWILSDQQCSKKLKRMMPAWLAFFTGISDDLYKELARISPASIDRYMKPFRATLKRRMNTGTRPGSRKFRSVIPLKNLENIASCAGHIEADTVAHCGGNMAGEFIWSLTVTDTYSGWTENRAVWGKHAKNVHEALADIEAKLPFEIQTLNCDNGSEFLNHRLVEYFAQGNIGPRGERQRFVMTRSRSYKKNDNAHVEQKNWTSVRQLFGYERLEFRELIPVMNEIYRVQNLFTNFWIPQFKLKSKVRVGAKVKKTYHPPATPYERLLADPQLPEVEKEKLRNVYSKLNPLDLRQLREELLASYFKLKTKLQSQQQVDRPLKPTLTLVTPGNSYN